MSFHKVQQEQKPQMILPPGFITFLIPRNRFVIGQKA